MNKENNKTLKQNKILEAAYTVFVEKGYSETTMDDICLLYTSDAADE